MNGQRITALSPIRSAGEAVLVGFRPLTPPYVVTAVGDDGARRRTSSRGRPRRSSASSRRPTESASMSQASDDVTVPGRGELQLRYVKEGDELMIALLALVLGVILGLVLRADHPCGASALPADRGGGRTRRGLRCEPCSARWHLQRPRLRHLVHRQRPRGCTGGLPR